MTARKAGLYLRISIDRTGQAAGVKRQEEDCRALAEQRGWRVDTVYTDNDISASGTKRRPEYRRMLAAIKSKRLDAVVSWHPDRLYRRLTDLEELIDLAEEHKVAIATVKAGDIDLATASGRMQARILASVAKHETERTSERVARWAEDRVAKGLPNGGGRRPYGLEWDEAAGTWKQRASEAAIVRRIVRDVLRGRSLNGIVRELNLEGVPTATGGRWSSTRIRRLVLSPTIAGLRIHRRTGQTLVGNWKGVISPSQRELLLALFSDPTRPRFAKSPAARTRLLSGILVCARCERKMYSNGSNGYVCSRTWGGCGHMRIAYSPLEDWVTWEAVRHFKRLHEAGRVVEHDAADEADTQPLIEERLQLQQRRDDWARKLALGEVDDHAYAVGVKTLDDHLAEIQTKLAAAVGQNAASVDDEVIDFVVAPMVGQNWTAMLSPKERLDRYEFLVQLIDKVVVSPAFRRGVRWESGRLEIVWRHS